MTLSLFLGVGLSLTAAACAAAFPYVPRRTRCPQCGRRTDAVLPPPWLKPGQRWLSMRWCAFCSWEGVGRRGPAHVPGRRVAHESGFHWNARRAGPDRGFQWGAPQAFTPRAEPPHHPSGFRFAAGRVRPGSDAADPSGFAWAPRPEAPCRDRAARGPG